MKDTLLLGRFGEAFCAEQLRRKGYRILAMNYRTRLGEIDLIAEDRRYIAFVEVKLRRSPEFAQAREFVTARKQQRILAAASSWLAENPSKKQPRFDVAEVYAPRGADTAHPEFRYIEDAFTAD
ncbi:MAG: YraN family protein [Oscillospiraceae bacterium]|nr:YraN family protein [Oscillospiraceae bacterium]